jgi:ABC-type transport system involved in multi-copper enzyme maturation permease subunit
MNTTSHRVKKLFVTNPMRMEITRFKSRFVRCTDSPTLNKALVGLVMLCYAAIVGLVFCARADVHPGAVIICQMVLSLLAAATAAHGAIAGERDRRSWDLLQVAPITQAEIVVGKFMGVLALIAALAVTFLPMVVIGLAFYRYAEAPNVYQLLLGEAITISAGGAAAAFTLYLSARLRNANTTLGTSIASLVGLLVVLPLGAVALLNGTSSLGRIMDVILAWHPVYAAARVLFGGSSDYAAWMNPFYGWPTVLLYSAVSWFFIARTITHLKRKASE